MEGVKLLNILLKLTDGKDPLVRDKQGVLPCSQLSFQQPYKQEPSPHLHSSGQSHQQDRMAALMENVAGKGPGDCRSDFFSFLMFYIFVLEFLRV